MSDDFEVGTEELDNDTEELSIEEDDSGTDDYEFDDEGEGSDDENPWGWAEEEGVDPKAVQKTWKQYTQTRQELKNLERQMNQERAEIEPFKKLREEIIADPGLVQTIEEYLANARPVDREVAGMKQEIQMMKTQMATEMELEKLNNWVHQNDYPKVDKEEILKYAVEHKIPNLQVAYKDMFFDELGERKVKQVTEGIKRSKGAASIPQKSKSGDKKKTGYTQADIQKMSDEDFINNYKNILESYAR